MRDERHAYVGIVDVVAYPIFILNVYCLFGCANACVLSGHNHVIIIINVL